MRERPPEALLPGPGSRSPREALLSSATDDHGTPSAYIEMGRDIMGGIDCDPFSSSYWNEHVVKARVFYDERTNGFDPKSIWFGKTWVNNPGKPRSGNTRRAWDRLIGGWRAGEIETAMWMGFQLNQLGDLQGAAIHPLQFLNLFPRERICFLIRNGGSAPIVSKDPTHANYITLLPTQRSASQARDQIAKFAQYAGSLTIGGQLVRPV